MSALLCPIQYVTHVMSPRVPLLLPLPMDPVLGLRHQMPLKPLGSTATTPTKPTASYPPTKYSLLQSTASYSLLQPPTKYSLLPSYKLYHAYIPTTVLLLPTKLLHSYIPNQSLVQLRDFFA